MSHYGRPEYSAVRCLLFGANLTDVGILRYVCLLFPDGKNILAYRPIVRWDLLVTFFKDRYDISAFPALRKDTRRN